MATLLLIIIYIAFISLGLPDPLIGAMWPAAHVDFSQPLSSAGAVSCIIIFGTVISSLLSTRIIRRFGTGLVTALSALLTGSVILLMSRTSSFALLCLLALPLGFGAGSVDTGLNSFVAIHFKASHMSFLHASWGVGATLGPMIVARSIALGNWRLGCGGIGGIQLGIALLLFCCLPLWRRFARTDEKAALPIETSLKKTLRLPMAVPVLSSLFCYCAAEITAGLWAASFLVTCLGLSAEAAARGAGLFYAGMLAGRFLSGFLAMRFRPRTIVRVGEAAAVLGALLMLLPLLGLRASLSLACALCGLLLVGLGCAPIYPTLLHETPKRFGEAYSQTMIGLSMATAYTGSAVVPLLLGLVAERMSLWILPVFLIAIYLAQFLLNEAANRRFSD